MLDSEGRPQFGELVRRSRMRKATSIQAASRKQPTAIFAFDLLELNGEDIRSRPLLERKALLKEVLGTPSESATSSMSMMVSDCLPLPRKRRSRGSSRRKRLRLTVAVGPAIGSRSRRRQAGLSLKIAGSGTSDRSEYLRLRIPSTSDRCTRSASAARVTGPRELYNEQAVQ
jgi:hypothetical protein